MSYWLFWGKIFKKKREHRGKEVKTRGKRGNFHCIRGKRYDFGKRGGGKNIDYLDHIHPW